jgi:hypothetical protein
MNRLALAAMLCIPLSTLAAPEGATAVGPMEIYPPHIRAAIDAQRRATLPGSFGDSVEMQGVYNRSKLWQPGQTLKVCFFDGLRDVRERIARVGKRWERFANIHLDVGDVASPRMCRSGDVNDIRIGYDYKGYWSTVGQDSVNVSRQSDESLNLDGFNSEPPSEPEFTRVVLHEFGHALGLQHEHQNPKSVCETEFDWAAIYESLARPPNGWDKAKVDSNMRRLLNDGDVKTLGEFDRQSIMLYTFPAWMYHKKEQSPCFFTQNTEISKTDAATLATMYPVDSAGALDTRTRDLKALRERLSAAPLNPEAKNRALRNVDILGTGASNPERQNALETLNAPLMR